ncbi:unnamed protein product [Cuscuta campestris]|uniref:Uncharacterized protein n=1 Tax=Cuscuta campestris TaxID=132261 RepID=A0A484LEF5_9ASTE|nr:unnamed protein product [Cuscuta campestris]
MFGLGATTYGHDSSLPYLAPYDTTQPDDQRRSSPLGGWYPCPLRNDSSWIPYVRFNPQPSDIRSAGLILSIDIYTYNCTKAVLEFL